MQQKAPEGKYAGTAKVGAKGQIVIPKEARAMFGIEPGDTLLVLADRERGIALMPQEAYMDIVDTILRAQGVPRKEEDE